MRIKFLTFLFAFGLLQGTLPAAYAESDNEPAVKKTLKKGKKGKKSKKSKKAKKADTEDKQAKDEEEAETTPKAESIVGKLLKANTYFNNKTPNYDADYFIFLKSASWCGPCCREMPEIVKAYKLMEASGKVELILLSHDRTQDAAEKWLAANKATFPAKMDGGSLPKFPPAPGIPFAIMMKADGTVIESGHGSIVRQWKNKTLGEFALLGDSDEPVVNKAISKMKFMNGKPGRKGEFFLYLYSPDLSSDAETLAELSEQYQEMKENKVEVILIANVESKGDLLRALKKERIKFPAILAGTDGVNELPGIGKLDKTAHVWMVSQGGGVAIDGELSETKNWQKVIEANAQ